MSGLDVHREAMPLTLAPMLASPGKLPDGDDWVFELKWDGVRAVIAHDSNAPSGKRLRIWSRKGNVVTATYPELAALEGPLEGHDVVLDGEIVAFDDAGRPSFNRIQERLGVNAIDSVVRAQMNPVVFVAFDLLHLDGLSTRSLPWTSRRQLLEQLDLGAGANWRISTLHDDGAAFLEVTRDADLEGVIAKQRSSKYSPGVRAPGWIKIKNLTIDEFVIGGWVPGEGRRESMIGALLLGIPSTDEPNAPLVWVGKAGTGFTMAELERLHALLAPDRTDTRPFRNDPGEKTAVFVASRHRCRVEYREITKEGILRFPSYKGLVTGPADATGWSDPVRDEEEDL